MKNPCLISTMTLFIAASSFAQSVTSAANQNPTPETALSVDQALQYGAENSKSAMIKASQLRASQAAFREAQSNLWPSLELSASGTYMTNPPKGMKVEAGALGNLPLGGGLYQPLPDKEVVFLKDSKATYFKGGVDLQWPLFTSGKILNAVALADSQVRESSLAVQQDKQQTIRDIRKAYFGAKLAKQTADLLNQMENLVTLTVTDTHNAFAQGMATREDVLISESRQASIHFQRVKSEQAYQTALEGLALLTGIDVQTVGTLNSDYRNKVPSLNKDELVAKTLATSPDRAAMQERLTQAARALDIENGNGPFRPNLALNVHLEASGQTPPFDNDKWTDDWNYNLSFTLGLQMNLFDGFKQTERANQARERLQQASIGLELNDKSIKLKIQQLIESVVSSGAEAEEKRVSSDLSAEREKNAKAAFDNDLATRDQYQSAQLATLASQLDYVMACYNVENGLSELEWVSGLAPLSVP